jgi:hypothetical protein
MFQKLYQQTIELIGLVWVWFNPTGVKIFTQPLQILDNNVYLSSLHS